MTTLLNDIAKQPKWLPGDARFFSRVSLTEQQYGPLHLALAYVQTQDGYEKWAVISDMLGELHTFAAAP